MIRFRKSIGYELSRYILVTMILFLAAILIFSIKYISNFFLKVTEKQSITIIHETDYKINSFFRDIENLSESLINYSAVYEARIPEMKELFISNVLARKKYIRAIYLGTESGEMFEWGWGEGFYDYTPSFPEGYNPRERPWYLKALEEKKHAITSPYLYASVDKPGITSVNPVYDRNTGAFVGVLGIDIMLDSMKDFLREINITENGKIALFSENGYAVASQFADNGNSGAVPIPELLINNIDLMKKEKTGKMFARSDSEDYYFVYNKNEVTGWFLAIGYPYSAITADLNSTLKFISGIYLMMTILLTFTLAGISRIIIVKPLENLFSVMKKIENGDMYARVNITSENEFSILGNQFNRLFELLKEYSQDLERKVQERTSEIIKLQRENTRLRIIEEKERIFSELHDSIGAKLTIINICNNVAMSLAGRENENLIKMLEVTDENCTNAVHELRDIVNGIIRQAPAEELTGFIDEEMPERLKLKNISTDIKWRADRKEIVSLLPDEAARDLVKIVEEISSNILKHSDAKNVRIAISLKKKHVEITISDDGSGFTCDPTEAMTGYGMKNIKQRMEKNMGTFNVESYPGKGTSVTLRVPAAVK